MHSDPVPGAPETAPSPGLLSRRTVQVHLTLRCNLSCAHCYSSSGPNRSESLEPGDLILRLARLRAEGYEIVSFSGGEPLVYPHIAEVLEGSCDLGYRANLITNGTLLSDQKLESIRPFVSIIGVSVDGAAARHDAMRGRSGRLERVARCFSRLRRSAIPFGISHCVTSQSIQDLPWLAEFAIEQGADILQLHPLTSVGRASGRQSDLTLSQADLERTLLVAELLRLQHRRLGIQLDVAPGTRLVEFGNRMVPADGQSPVGHLSDWANPLVMDVEGGLWPLAYGMHSSQRLAPSALDEWNTAISRAKADRLPRLRALVAATCETLAREDLAAVDWYGRLVEQSYCQIASPISDCP